MSTLAECIQGSSSAAFMKASEFSSLSSIPKLSSPPFLQTFFFSALFSILLPINLIAVMPLFFFLSSFSCISLKNALLLNTLPLFFQIASANALVSPAILSSETRDYIEAASTAADLSVCLTEAEQA